MFRFDPKEFDPRLSSSQEERRNRLLAEQKKGRNDLLNKIRGLTKSDCTEPDDGSISRQSSTYNKCITRYRQLVMLSEWLTEIPCDFQDCWTFVFCPEGKRNLLIAKNGKTKVYSRHGVFINSFRSVLPLGHHEDDSTSKSGEIILDVIWNAKTKSYYVLDVLQWKNQIFFDCEREFRFSWLQSKFLELQEDGGDYMYSVTLLPEYSVFDIQGHALNYPVFQNNVPGVDGVLFFHKQGHYKSGITPLVTWLKTFMLPEVLNIIIAEEYVQEKPVNYTTLNDYLANKKIKNKKKKKSTRKMEIEDIYVDCCEFEEAEMGAET